MSIFVDGSVENNTNTDSASRLTRGNYEYDPLGGLHLQWNPAREYRGGSFTLAPRALVVGEDRVGKTSAGKLAPVELQQRASGTGDGEVEAVLSYDMNLRMPCSRDGNSKSVQATYELGFGY
ncbi:MAG: hypothetical protein AAAFM81_06410 [Pseudomonadota bacterium]